MNVLRDLDKDTWSRFVTDHPHGTIFQSPEMWDIVKETKYQEPLFLAVTGDSDGILGLLLAVIQREHSGILGTVSARSIILGGPLIKDSPGDRKTLELLLSEYDEHVKRLALYSQIRNLWDCSHFKETYLTNGFDHEHHLNFLLDLSRGEDLVWKGMNKKRRNAIRKGQKEGTVIEEIVDLKGVSDSYSILEQVYSNAKLPIADCSLFTSAFKILHSREMVKCFMAYYEDKPIGTIWTLNYKGRMYDWYAGGLLEHLDKHPNDMLPWHAMKWGMQNYYRLFDFGGAGRPDVDYGVRDFKSKFGGELVDFGRFQKIHKPFLYSVGKVGFSLWRKFRR